jgi:hypothetical protein
MKDLVAAFAIFFITLGPIWGGAAGTAFWISPRNELFAILMVQTPEHREYFRVLFRTLVNAAIV